MPIEIKELHIKINVSDSGNSAGPADGTAGASDPQQVIDEVMELLRKQKER